VPFMTRIPSDLARFGLKVELAPGWATRGSSSFAPACVVNHWTAGPRGTKTRPSLHICINGRTGLPGPLCNIYLARDGTCVVVAAGRANHAGTGGFRGLVGNSAAYGIEAECGGDGDWTPAMLEAYPRLDAALMSGLGRDASWVTDHSTWAPTRKIDCRDIKDRLRADAAKILAAPAASVTPPKEGPELDATERQMLTNIHATLAPGQAGVRTAGDVWRVLAEIHHEVTARLEPRGGTDSPGPDTVLGHAAWAAGEARAARQALATLGAGGLDAEDVAEALTSTPGFVDTLADALADRLAQRLSS
jgi:hypothetical protein